MYSVAPIEEIIIRETITIPTIRPIPIGFYAISQFCFKLVSTAFLNIFDPFI